MVLAQGLCTFFNATNSQFHIRHFNKVAQKSYPSTDDGHGWVEGDPPSVIRSGWYGWPKPPIRHP